jgi:hypothetical protein
MGTLLRIYASVAEANAQKRTRPRVGIGRSPFPPPLFSMVSVMTADTPADANSIHSTDISPELVRTIEAGSSRPSRPRAGANVSTTTLAAGRIPTSVLINAPLALTFSRHPRHLQPVSRDCIHLSRTGMLLTIRCPQRCSIDLSLELVFTYAASDSATPPSVIVRMPQFTAQALAAPRICQHCYPCVGWHRCPATQRPVFCHRTPPGYRLPGPAWHRAHRRAGVN